MRELFKLDVAANQEYQAALEFKKGFSLSDDLDELSFDWVVQYAHWLFDRLIRSAESLDAKADSIIKLLGGGAGLLTLGAITRLPDLSASVVVSLSLALTFALAAVMCATIARRPQQTFAPPSVGWATAYVIQTKSKDERQFLGEWHLACEGIRLGLSFKSKWVSAAYWFATISFVAVAITFGIAASSHQSSELQNTPQKGNDMTSDKPETPNTPPPSMMTPSSDTQPVQESAPAQQVNNTGDTVQVQANPTTVTKSYDGFGSKRR